MPPEYEIPQEYSRNNVEIITEFCQLVGVSGIIKNYTDFNERRRILRDHSKTLPQENHVRMNNMSPWFNPRSTNYATIEANPCIAGILARRDETAGWLLKIFHLPPGKAENVLNSETYDIGLASSGWFIEGPQENDRRWLAQHNIQVLTPPNYEPNQPEEKISGYSFNLLVEVPFIRPEPSVKLAWNTERTT